MPAMIQRRRDNGYVRVSSTCLPHTGPRLPDEKRGIGALARRVLLHPAGPHFGGVEVAVLVGGEPVDAPLAALARTERAPRIEEVALGVVANQLVRSLVG